MKHFLSLITLGLTLCTVKADDRPNILWIYLEDVSGWFSCYGEELIETPRMDGLAKEGIRFDRFYTPAGVCSATRSAIVTGMMQTTIGAHNHRSCRPDFRGKAMGGGPGHENEYDKNVLPEKVVPLPIQFRKAGYWTFNEGGKDDYNFEHSADEFYDVLIHRGWGPKTTVSGECWKDRKKGQPFFGQVQLGGGKLSKKVTIEKQKEAAPDSIRQLKMECDSKLNETLEGSQEFQTPKGYQ